MRMKQRRKVGQRSSADGFTLIELLVSITITTIILGAVTTAMIAFYENGAYTSRRNDHSAGAHLLATYLDRDLSSAMSGAATANCAGQPAGTPLLAVGWTQWTVIGDDPTPVTGDVYYANYLLTTETTQTDNPGGGTRQQLERWYCAPSAGVADHEIILTDLAPSGTGISKTTTGSGCTNGTLVKVTLRPYEADSVADYGYLGCLGSRTG